MKSPLPFLIFAFLLAVTITSGQDGLSAAPKSGEKPFDDIELTPNKPQEKKKDEDRTAFKLPNPGERINKPRIIRYDNGRINSIYTADYVEVLTEEELFGVNMVSRIYNENGTETIIRMEDGALDREKGILKSRKRVLLQDHRFTALGTGVVIDSQTKEIFLSGPVKTVFDNTITQSKTTTTTP